MEKKLKKNLKETLRLNLSSAIPIIKKIKRKIIFKILISSQKLIKNKKKNIPPIKKTFELELVNINLESRKYKYLEKIKEANNNEIIKKNSANMIRVL